MLARTLILFSIALLLLSRVGVSQEQIPTAIGDELDNTVASVSEVVAGEDAKTEFLRVLVKDDKPHSLDTAIVSYRSENPEGVAVDLIGAVHIGEASYYEELNRKFDQYDVLLYELVAPEGTTVPRGGQRPAGFNPVALMQDGAKSMLGLELQLEKIDYTKQHFVRADMTPEQMAKKMAERGDTPFTLLLDAVAEVMRQQNKALTNNRPSVFEIERELSLADMLGNPLKMKRLLAAQFAETGALDQSLGKSLNQLLIVDRNAEALKGLQKQIAAGKKKIGIFYGAAHLPDFEAHLMEDFGLYKEDHQWLTAWDLTRAKQPSLSEPVGLLLNILKAIE